MPDLDLDQRFVLVGVMPGPAPDLPDALLGLLDGAEITPEGPPRLLGAGEASTAAEIVFRPPSHTAAEALHGLSATFFADTAILPLANRRKRLLISDMDSTIIGEECLDELADFAGLKTEISAITERAMRGELNFEEALTTRVAMLKGLPLQAVKDCFETRIHLNRGATTLVATMAAEGARCLLVSGGFTAFTEQVANAAGFHGHSANTLIDDGASLTGKVQLPILGRAAKLDRLNQAVADLNIELRDTLAIGDGANDLAMIEAAGLGLAYRAKPIVAEKAHASIAYTDLTSALFFQGYHEDEFVTS